MSAAMIQGGTSLDLVRERDDGTLVYEVRVTWIFACRLFPFDDVYYSETDEASLPRSFLYSVPENGLSSLRSPSDG